MSNPLFWCVFVFCLKFFSAAMIILSVSDEVVPGKVLVVYSTGD